LKDRLQMHNKMPPIRVRSLLFVALTSSLHTAALSGQSSRLGSLEASSAEQFGRIGEARGLTSTLLLVTDLAARALYAIDLTTGKVTTVDFGGDIGMPSRIYPISRDSFLVTDAASRKWYVLKGTNVVDAISARDPAPEIFGPDLSGVDESGVVLGAVGYRFTAVQGPGTRGEADSLAVMRWRLGAGEHAPIDTIAKVGGTGRFGVRVVTERPYVMFRPSPAASEDQAWLFPDGWIAIAHTQPYSVDWRRPDGSWIRGPEVEWVPVQLTDTEKCNLLRYRQLDQDLPECDPQRRNPPWPSLAPPFLTGALIGAPDGSLLIRRTPSVRQQHAVYDLFDRSGRRSSISMPATDRIVGTGPAHVIVARKAPDGREGLRVYKWNPSSRELHE
jgi:hypothetical protein